MPRATVSTRLPLARYPIKYCGKAVNRAYNFFVLCVFACLRETANFLAAMPALELCDFPHAANMLKIWVINSIRKAFGHNLD